MSDLVAAAASAAQFAAPAQKARLVQEAAAKVCSWVGWGCYCGVWRHAPAFGLRNLYLLRPLCPPWNPAFLHRLLSQALATHEAVKSKAGAGREGAAAGAAPQARGSSVPRQAGTYTPPSWAGVPEA